MKWRLSDIELQLLGQVGKRRVEERRIRRRRRRKEEEKKGTGGPIFASKSLAQAARHKSALPRRPDSAVLANASRC